jgi:FAD/FMN-containing dehydrogenase
MNLAVSSVPELSEALAKAFVARQRISAVALGPMKRVLEYRPEDMTITVETGLTLAALRAETSKNRQWLPIDPPFPGEVTIDQLLNENLSGPRRFGYGTIREHLLGLKAVLADGRIIQNGGKVVKNVAGFDLCKLLVGSRWSLGIVVEATFKLRPIPRQEVFVRADFSEARSAILSIESILGSELVPIVLDLYSKQFPGCSAVLGIAGSEEEVEWQMALAKDREFSAVTTLDYQDQFWRATGKPKHVSVLPSRVAEELLLRTPESFVARAGDGIIYYRGGTEIPNASPGNALDRKVKETFDPRNILPELLAP